MKIIFRDPETFTKLENEAIDGVLNYDDFPPEEYKYFSKLAKLGYNNRHKGWDIGLCEEKQAEYRLGYYKEKEYAGRFVTLFRKINDDRIKATELKAKLYKARSVQEITEYALQIIELLIQEGGFVERIHKKMKNIRIEEENNE